MLLVVLLPLWVPVTLVYDLVRGKFRLPTTRLMLFGLCWAWIESAGVMLLFLLWVVGHGRDHRAHYRVQGWWCGRIIAALRVTVCLRVEVVGDPLRTATRAAVTEQVRQLVSDAEEQARQRAGRG